MKKKTEKQEIKKHKKQNKSMLDKASWYIFEHLNRITKSLSLFSRFGGISISLTIIRALS